MSEARHRGRPMSPVTILGIDYPSAKAAGDAFGVQQSYITDLKKAGSLDRWAAARAPQPQEMRDE
jgi:hypothetical protein